MGKFTELSAASATLKENAQFRLVKLTVVSKTFHQVFVLENLLGICGMIRIHGASAAAQNAQATAVLLDFCGRQKSGGPLILRSLLLELRNLLFEGQLTKSPQ